MKVLVVSSIHTEHAWLETVLDRYWQLWGPFELGAVGAARRAVCRWAEKHGQAATEWKPAPGAAWADRGIVFDAPHSPRGRLAVRTMWLQGKTIHEFWAKEKSDG